MNTLIRFAKNNDFSYDKKREIAFARKEGYYIILKELKAKKQILMKMNLKNSTEDSVDINQFFNQLDGENRFVEAATYNENEALIVIGGPHKNIAENINTVIKKVVSFCNINKIQNACLLCGSNSDLNVYGVGENADILCHNCYGTAKIDIQQNLSKANFPKGLLGAFLGSLVGVVLWVVIYQLGYIAGIAGAAMVIFAFRGFKMFGKELTFAGVICSILISFMMIPFSVYLSWSIDLFSYLGEGITFSECFGSLIYFMLDNDEIFRGMIGEMVMGYFLYLIAAVSTIVKTIKSSKIQHKTEVLIGQ